MGRVYRARMSVGEEAEVWHRWKRGESCPAIGRALDRTRWAVYDVVAAWGGIPPPPRTRARRVLGVTEREEISRGLARGDSLRQIGRGLGRAPSTVSREVRRHGGRRHYRAAGADTRAWAWARRPKPCRLAGSVALRTLVATKLARNWSPQQIAGWLTRTFPDDPCLHVSHETIYRSLFVQSRGVLKRELIGHLRRRPRIRRTRPGTRARHRRGGIPDAVSIRARPATVADRAVPGHWEGDLLTGGRHSYIATLVERQSRFVVLVRLANKETHTVVAALTTAVRALPAGFMASLTWDRGMELAAHHRFTVTTNVQVYFCDPQSPSARTRTPMACCGSTSRRGRTCRRTLKRIWTPSRSSSTHVPARRWDTPRQLIDWRPLLHRPVESTSFSTLLSMGRTLPNAGCVGIGGGFINNAGRIFEVSDWWENPVRQFDYMPVDFNSGCCMLLERAFANAHDIRFDERYRLYWEDVDLSHQVTGAGRAVYMVNNRLVGTRHLRSATITALLGIDTRERIRAESETYYRSKWQGLLRDPARRVSAITYAWVFPGLRLVPIPEYEFTREAVTEHGTDAAETAPYEFLEVQEDYAAAIDGYKALIGRNPENVMAYRNLCRAVSRANLPPSQSAEVATTVTKFLRSRPPAVVRQALFVLIQDAVLQIADRLAREGRYTDAIVHYQEIYEIAQTARAVATCELQIAKMTYLIGDVDAAERRLREWVIKNDRADLPSIYQASARTTWVKSRSRRAIPHRLGNTTAQCWRSTSTTAKRQAVSRRSPPQRRISERGTQRGRRQSWGLFRTAQRKSPVSAGLANPCQHP